VIKGSKVQRSKVQRLNNLRNGAYLKTKALELRTLNPEP
jgi:hypothetical protein